MKKTKEVFFHTVHRDGPRAGKINWQGIVLTELPLGHLEVQLYSWLTGEPTDIKIVDGKDYKWIFYTSEDAWTRAGDASMK